MNAPVVRTHDLKRKYKDVLALDEVNLSLEANKIYGLLGRNGAGKTTLMSILTAQGFASSGQVEVFGENPYENHAVLSRVCFIRESQKYPDGFNAIQAFRAASLFFSNWDQDLATELAKDFELPTKRVIKKLSRGQLSAVGIIIGLASRAELTFFDEPYLGLDAVARHLFYDHLVRDYAKHPRTVILSSHLIDEVANLLEHVIVIDRGRILINEDAEAIRGSAVTVQGKAEVVTDFVAGYPVLAQERLLDTASVTVKTRLSAAQEREAAELGLSLVPASLQQIVVHESLAHQPGHDGGPLTHGGGGLPDDAALQDEWSAAAALNNSARADKNEVSR